MKNKSFFSGLGNFLKGVMYTISVIIIAFFVFASSEYTLSFKISNEKKKEDGVIQNVGDLAKSAYDGYKSVKGFLK